MNSSLLGVTAVYVIGHSWFFIAGIMAFLVICPITKFLRRKQRRDNFPYSLLFNLRDKHRAFSKKMSIAYAKL